MILWLATLAAHSIQLAVLIGGGAATVSALRADAPRPSLRFWQLLFTASLLWPVSQIWMNVGSPGERLAGGVLWSVASFAEGMPVAAPSGTGGWRLSSHCWLPAPC